jgi:hypothetical protein
MKKAVLGSVLVVAAMVLVVAAVQAQDHTYVGADKCKMCHKVQYNSWLETSHAKALDAAKASTDPAFGAECLGCHATNKDEALAGVQCEACHGPGSDYKKMSVMKDQAAAVANGLIIPSQATCDGCHKDDGHSKAVKFSDNKENRAAIHEFKGEGE